MNTKLILTFSAILLGAAGILLTFLPELLLDALRIPANRPALIFGQLMGGLYFGFAMLNWMAKGTRIGGIYNRPIATANFAHFFISGMALIKAIMNDPSLSKVLWGAAVIYSTLGVLFIIILFRHPITANTE